ncbi:hypothetical protein EUGRSUZ_E01633 [Eucalyptus grandis]|uniref:Uncharacterized protein n=2 Tax=Eucalyptus grandis TaxID=71139 RepID=A0ACC3KVG4_EUCGR|nr:hypothetical protein EUGRSUZ_E01633 [Eucalyptus grandis]
MGIGGWSLRFRHRRMAKSNRPVYPNFDCVGITWWQLLAHLQSSMSFAEQSSKICRFQTESQHKKPRNMLDHTVTDQVDIERYALRP